MRCIAVFDTNILVSAIISASSDSPVVAVLDKVFSKEIIPVWSDEIIAEYNDVLHRSKFGFDEGIIQKYIGAVKDNGIKVEPSAVDIVLPDMKDLPFYEVVMEKRDDGAYLVTGNLKHFPVEPFIVTARQLLDILDGKEEIKI